MKKKLFVSLFLIYSLFGCNQNHQNMVINKKKTKEKVHMSNTSQNQKMDENEFWKIIDMFDWDHEGDDETVLEEAVNYLSKSSNEDIFAFEDILSKLLYDLDGIEYAKNIGEYAYVDEEEFFSVDNFLYARCVVVANGRDFYYEVLQSPEEMPKDIEFESLLSVAREAYEQKNDEEFDYMPKFDYETYSNKGKWRE
ncbi:MULTISPECIES: DUF4240 domain-containing protein [Bacillus]|uniref:DUF4240 domain-containing protein n=2 Tax=Bacillaceae TaxID=186817 RepID=UPI000B33BA9C|nr:MULTISPECIES: DUF4240 domain-containing protein [Bacillus cereus group]MDA2059686.1 DUF4240 domain-containing protein [Bacillus cereus]